MAEKNYQQFDVLTIDDLCEIMNISHKYAYEFIRKNNFKFVQVGKKFYISKSSLEKFLKEG